MNSRLGKLGPEAFASWIHQKCGASRPEVSTPARFGVDVSIVDLPGGLAMAMTSDPLTLIPEMGLAESAWLSVHLMANDMATTGCAPQYGQFVLNLPATFSAPDFKIYWEHIHQYCAKLGMAITGGHTGFIEGQNSTIAGGGTLITIAPKEQLLVASNAREGDALLVTKYCGLSAAAILAMRFPQTVRNQAGQENYLAACASFHQTSSLPEALIAVEATKHPGTISAMHDVTEGGVLGAIYELATAAKKGVRIYNENLPKGPVQESVFDIFSLDSRHCIGAGSMIICCAPDGLANVQTQLRQKGIEAAMVGLLTPPDQGIMLVEKGQKKPITLPASDPYWTAYFTAIQSGLK